MMHHDWPAEDYAIGSYIQGTVADLYLQNFHPKPNDSILDVGCGDGHYSFKILEKVPQGNVLGIDASETMLQLAKENTNKFSNFSVRKNNIQNINFNQKFDAVVSFWCLQWTTDICLAFENIHKALKPGGQVFLLFPSGDDPFMKGYQAVKNSGQFPELTAFKAPMHYGQMDNLQKKLQNIPFQSLTVDRSKRCIELPNIDVFRRFVNGIGYYQGQISDEKILLINETMVAWYDRTCKQEFGGKYLFYFSPFFITGKK